MTKGFSIVVAMDRNRGIGKDGKLPWKLSGDMRFFKELTTCPDREAVETRWGFGANDAASWSWAECAASLKEASTLPESPAQNIVLMGRKTYESLPDKYRPLPGRKNVALSRYGYEWPSVIVARNLDALGKFPESVHKFVIGGGQVFESALPHPSCTHLYVTEIDAVFECDTFFPEIPSSFRPVLSSPWIEENGVRYRFRRYDRVS